MANSFNVVTALQTIHEHTHAVGFGCIPSGWTAGGPAAFCEANNLFVPGLAAWFFDAVRRPFGDGSCESGISLPRDCTWDVRDRKIGSGWRRIFSCGSHSPLSVMEIMEMGGGKREVRFIFRRNPEALLGALWCLNMMGRVGFMPFGPQVYLLHTMKHGDGLLLDAGRVAQACGRVEIRRVPLAFGAQCFVWTTPLHCAAGGYNLSFRSGVDCDAPKPSKLGCFWDIL